MLARTLVYACLLLPMFLSRPNAACVNTLRSYNRNLAHDGRDVLFQIPRGTKDAWVVVTDTDINVDLNLRDAGGALDLLRGADYNERDYHQAKIEYSGTNGYLGPSATSNRVKGKEYSKSMSTRSLCLMRWAAL